MPSKNREHDQKTFDYLVEQEPVSRSDFLKEVTLQLRRQRRHLGWTLDKVNRRLGVATRLVNKWECGDKTPSGFNMFSWAKVLGLEIVLVPVELATKLKEKVDEHYKRD